MFFTGFKTVIVVVKMLSFLALMISFGFTSIVFLRGIYSIYFFVIFDFSVFGQIIVEFWCKICVGSERGESGRCFDAFETVAPSGRPC